ncbi:MULTISPECIES: 4-hydroxy-tetrahydrodipicolinate reductase [Sphingomonas]|uniref:4-hydroxy-tetrahydrodipicolinate reductase n=1 Tax=Sphingomonas TaxID=13687 RepID=UPI000DEF21C2|nr:MULTISPECIES: 4-hydroxy-tetrahydrodipicolinate reductase [Sphingomonas]
MRPDTPIRLTLIAPNGRMGQAIAALVADDPDFTIDQNRGDVLVDFSAPSALLATLDRAREADVPVLVGTTGLDDEAHRLLTEAAREIAIVVAANTSLGVALLSELVERAAAVLGDGWDAEILELHHRRKADAPSGTALALGQAVARGRGVPLTADTARAGTQLTRRSGEVGFAAVRGGTVVGDHDVMFLGVEERVIISHRAEDRRIFARGALAAARYLVGRAPGLYSMADVIRAR